MSDGIAVTVERAAELLHCRRTRVFQLLAEGRLERAQSAGRKTLVLTNSIESFLLAPMPVPKTRAARRNRKLRQLSERLRAVPLDGGVG